MASGWAKEGAVQEQIEDTVEDGVEWARSQLPQGESRSHCADCGEAIPQARRQAIPGVQLCIDCQSERDEQRQSASLFNRRASKDSQLR